MSGTVWITGASSGIGKALALRLAAEGATVAISARSEDKLEAIARQAAKVASNVQAFPLDVTDGAATARAVDAIEQRCGPITTAVLAAGTHQPVTADGFRADELRKLVEINLIGVANSLEVLMRRMMERRSGRIAVVSSIAGYRGLPTSAYYGASKAALINLTESLKFDLDQRGVTLQLVDPGFVRTPLTDKNEFSMPFLIEPEVAAERIARGLRSGRFEITFPRRFTWMLKLLRCLPYALYFPIVARGTSR